MSGRSAPSTSIDVQDTPMTDSAQLSGLNIATVAQQRPIIFQELAQHKLEVANLHTQIYDRHSQLPGPSAVTKHLNDSKLYNSTTKRWNLPVYPSLEEHLYDPYEEILSDILSNFKYGIGKRSKFTPYEDTRAVIKTNNVQMKHQGLEDIPESEGTSFKTSPDLLITGSGKIEAESGHNFAPSAPKKNDVKPAYTNCVTPAEIKRDSTRNFDKDLAQITVYARQTFIHQNNRQFVYCLLLTESFARLFLFDRSGVCYSEEVNIHEKPVEFVQMILLVSSPDCAVVGCDTSIYWKTGPDRVSSRYIKTVDREGSAIEYRIDNKGGRPYFSRETIKGRGTCCWMVDGGLLVKDQWVSEGRVPEQEYLKEAQDLEFVGQMVACENGTSTAVIRGFASYEDDCSDEDKQAFRNRLFSRITLKYAGKKLKYFSTTEELIYALRDAIKGHRNLWNNNLLHRDISINNILIMPAGTPGARGNLIDLDMAIRLDRTRSLAATDFRTGTRAFQSINVLLSYDKHPNGIRPPHDHLDDMESFFYVFSYVVEGYVRPGHKVYPPPPHHFEWQDNSVRIAKNSKIAFFFFASTLHSVQPFFQDPVLELYNQYFLFIKEKLTMKQERGTSYPSLTDLKTDAEKDYARVLKLFDDCIEKLQALPGFKDPNLSVPEPKTPEKRPVAKRKRDAPPASLHREAPEFVTRRSSRLNSQTNSSGHGTNV